jgi:hypothetical protein
MATTTNYGWTTPNDTDLVKNGANAIRTLGDAIDNTVGLRFLTTPSASNPVINSAFQVWQRGTSIAVPASTTNQYTADRWSIITQANQATTVSRQATGDTTNLPNIQYCARVQRNSGQTGTGNIFFASSFETINSIPYVGKTITLSYYARAGANYSPTSGNLQFYVYSGTGTDQSILGTYTGSTIALNSQATLTTTWKRFTVTGTIASTATELALTVIYTPTGTAGTNDYFEITGVQIDIGSVALPFRTTGTLYQQELSLCQRYYYRAPVAAAAHLINGFAKTTTTAEGVVTLPVSMRIVPTALEQSGTASDYLVAYANTAVVCSSVPTFVSPATNNTAVVNFTTTAVLTVGNGVSPGANTANGYLAWTAEL